MKDEELDAWEWAALTSDTLNKVYSFSYKVTS